MKRVIEPEEINKVHNFVLNSIYEFLKLNVQSSELIICLPNWLKHLLLRYPMHYSVPFSHNYDPRIIFEIEKFFDVSTQPHYKDEVVVFFQNYHLGNEKFSPRIYEIKIQP
jgi:hypothetical protein